MPRLHSPHRRSLIACCIALSALGFLGCSPAPEPEPTPTPAFASEEEAFAAAEETYRAYIDALNGVDISNPETFEPVFSRTTGEFQVGDRENLSQLHAAEVQMTGSNVMTGFVGLRSSPARDTVVGRVCVDVSDVELIDKSGASAVSPNRAPRYAIDATFTFDAGELLIESATQSEVQTCD